MGLGWDLPGNGSGTGLAPWVTVSSMADLDAFSSPDGFGVRDLGGARLIVLERDIVVPTGERFETGVGGSIITLAPQSAGFVFDVDGVAIGGQGSQHNLVVTQNNAGPDAWCAELSTAGVAVPVASHCSYVGLRGLRFNGVAGFARVVDCGIFGAITGIAFTGSIFSATVTITGTAAMQPGGVAFRVQSDCTVVAGGALLMTAPAIALEAGQYAFEISDTFVGGDGSVIPSGSLVSGELKNLFRLGPGFMALDDNRLLATANPNGNFAASITASRTDFAVPLVVDHGAANPNTIPFTAGAIDIAEVESSHWTLVDEGGGAWHLLYGGLKPAEPHSLTMTLQIQRASASGNADVWFERATAAAPSTYIELDTSHTPLRLTNAYQQGTITGTAAFTFGDRLRPRVENVSGDTVNSEIGAIKLSAVSTG